MTDDTNKNEATILLWLIDTLGAAGWRVIFNRDDARAWIEIRRERMIHGMPRPAAGRDNVPATIAALRELARAAGVRPYQSEPEATGPTPPPAGETTPGELRSMGHIGPPDGRMRRP